MYQLASKVESSGEAIFSKTLQGVITSWNSSAEQLFGYTADEIIGKSLYLLVPPERQKEVAEVIERIMKGDVMKDYETTWLRKDGTLVDVSVTDTPIRDSNGKIIASSTIAHEISERKRVVAELIALNSALAEGNRVREQFLSTISHELRTPLATIISFSQTLLDEAKIANLDQEQHNHLERILKNSQYLLALVNDVLDLKKIETKHMELKYSQVNVRELLTSVVEEMQPMAMVKDLVLRAEVAEGIDFLESNQLKLHQLLFNLVSNAFKFTEQGEVTISATSVISSEQHQIAFEVKDSGMGISSEMQARIFEAFYQADGSYTRKAGETGLGLTIVRQLTALLGGTIAVKSAPGQGSTFTVLLPIKAVDASIEAAFQMPDPASTL